jgi:hypothetical protein
MESPRQKTFTLLRTQLSVAAVLTFILLIYSAIQSQEAYAEVKKVSVTSKLIKVLMTTNDIYPDQTKVRFINNLQIFSSADPDWNNAKVFGVRYFINPTRDGDPYRGCVAITHNNGDQTFIKFEGSWKWAEPKDGVSWISESKGEFIGAQANLRALVGPLRLRWREQVRDIMYQVFGNLNIKWHQLITKQDFQKLGSL